MMRPHCRTNYPDVGNGAEPCCMGAAAMGPDRCTCWKPVYDKIQLEPKAGPRCVRLTMCQDCAFRSDSPERQGDERFDHSDEDGFEDIMLGEFLCHQGMRRLVHEVHPTGAVLDVAPGAYEPGDPPRKSDGSPADYCAGWWAEKQRRAREAAAADEEGESERG